MEKRRRREKDTPGWLNTGRDGVSVLRHRACCGAIRSEGAFVGLTYGFADIVMD